MLFLRRLFMSQSLLPIRQFANSPVPNKPTRNSEPSSVSTVSKVDATEKPRLPLRSSADYEDMAFSDYVNLCASEAFTTSTTPNKSAGGKSGLSKEGSAAKLPTEEPAPFVPRRLLTEDYSLHKLLATRFPEECSLRELGQLMAKALGDTTPAAIIRTVEKIGRKHSLEVFEEVKKVESTGGMYTKLRRRSPGGIFFHFLYDERKLLNRTGQGTE